MRRMTAARWNILLKSVSRDIENSIHDNNARTGIKTKMDASCNVQGHPYLARWSSHQCVRDFGDLSPVVADLGGSVIFARFVAINVSDFPVLSRILCSFDWAR